MDEAIGARKVFEDHLRDQFLDRDDRSNLSDEAVIARRLLERGDELAEAYLEIYRKVPDDPSARRILLLCMISTAAFSPPHRFVQDRIDSNQLALLNQTIARCANELADLLAQREDLHNCSGFSSSTHYDIVEVINDACSGNGYYEYFLKEPLRHLNAKFDMKYWPRLSEVVGIISADAAGSQVAASDLLTEVGTRSARASTADFTRAFIAAIYRSRGTWEGALPHDFVLSDQTIASLVNILLDLPSEQMVDAIHVKNSRHKQKKLKPKS